MSILSNVKTFIATYSGLDAAAPITSDNVGDKPPWYGIYPISGNPIIDEDILGKKRKRFPFVLRSVEYTLDELERLDTIDFFEGFQEWLEAQSNAGNLPTLASGKTPESIEAIDWAYLFEVGATTGVYQIQCALIFTQDPL